MKTPESLVDEMLAAQRSKQTQHSVNRYPDLVRALVRFLDVLQEGSTHVTLTWFYENKLKPAFGGPSVESVRRYIRAVLRRNPTTGASLDEKEEA